jgi:CRP-like cAMP-binding protein
MSAVRELSFRPGDSIVLRGDPANHFYVLESGKAEVWAEPLSDKDQQSTGVNSEGLVLVATLGRCAN